MPRESIPPLRRNHSSSEASSIDPYDQAEQGFHAILNDFNFNEQPVEPKKTLYLRSSLRSSDSTLAGSFSESTEPELIEKPGKRLPSQGKC